ncbi:hypothetical protein AGMMS49938_06540 [Fibrobacterales bacterium]|nr:hypothetical protein AGMMS49938_06540 [Fibrobacterales bacterium]
MLVCSSILQSIVSIARRESISFRIWTILDGITQNTVIVESISKAMQKTLSLSFFVNQIKPIVIKKTKGEQKNMGTEEK